MKRDFHLHISNKAKNNASSLIQVTQPAITCSKLTIEELEQRCEICSKLTIKPPKRQH